MRFYPLIKFTTLLWCTLSNSSLSDPARKLQIFGGTLSEITCSAALPVFRLVKQEIGYGPEEYSQLPGSLNMEIRASPTGNSVTLFINGTERSNNVTVMCRDFSNAVFGQVDTLFMLELEFVSILPAPSEVWYIDRDPAAQLRIMWEPPTLLHNELSFPNVSIDSRITHYTIYTTTGKELIAHNTSDTETSFNIVLDSIVSCSSVSFQVAAVNLAGVGERSPVQVVHWCMDIDSTSSTGMELPSGVSNLQLTAGIIATIAILICAVVSIVATALFVVIALAYAKHKNGKSARVFNSKGVEVDLAQNPHDPEDTHKDQKQTESDSFSRGDIDHVQKQQSEAKKIETGRAPLIYADVITVKQTGAVPEPSSVDPTKYSAVEHQHPNQVIQEDSGSIA